MNTNSRAAVNADFSDLPLFSFKSSCVGDLPFLPTILDSPKLCEYCNTQKARERGRFCSKRCERADRGRMEREARRSRIADIIANGPQSPTGELTELDKDAAKLYLDGLGAGSIAKIQKRDKKVVRDSLLKAGVYAPKPEFIRIAGVGESSRIVADLKRKEQRKVAASIIRLMRKGVKAETAAKQLGARIPSALIQSKWYKKLAQKRKSGKWVRMSSTFRVSAKYKDEYAFQDAIQEALKAFNIRHTRECTEPSGGRYDFDVLGWIVECKIDMRTKVAATAIGQCARYLAQRPGRVCLLIPNDVAIHPNDFKILDSMRVQVLREKNVASFFLGSGTT